MKKQNITKKVAGRKRNRVATELVRGAVMTKTTVKSVHCQLLEEVSSTSTMVKCIEEIDADQWMLTREQL